PVVLLMLLITAVHSQRHVYSAALLAVIEAAVLSLSGFRSAAAVFLLAILVLAALALPKRSPWRRPSRATAVTAMVGLVAIASFIAAANVRNAIATELGVSSQGTR